jgi:two-component system, OmpR family, alkaline phosphatase synthesis response regulator PhoP
MTATVLVVEDEADIMLTLRLTLQVAGYRVVGVGSGEEALSYFARTPPDVTILDIGLPGIDGLEVVRRLRADPWHREARLIISSAHASGDVRRLTEALRCSAYLTKPFSTEELIQTVSVVLAAAAEQQSAPETL